MDEFSDHTQSDNTVLEVLEWDRFIELAQLEAKTIPGKQILDDLLEIENWAQSPQESNLLQQETAEITPLLDREALWSPLVDLDDPEDLLDRLQRGATLELEDLKLLRRWLYAIDSWVQIPREEIQGDLFKKTLASLSDPFEILRAVEKILTPEGELSEKASPRLGSLYAEIRAIKRNIGILLDSLIKTYSQKGILQETYSDLRDGRFVLPVKISAQSDVEGILYEASVSKQTVFIEPAEVAPLNNQLRQKQNDLIQEIYSILLEISKKIRPFAEELDHGIHALSYWDAVQAKANLGRHFSGKTIEVTEERLFSLRQTAHPLLWWSLPTSSIIRNEIDFGIPIKSLLLTGPNTGGKTVFLKTLGIAGICARTGFPFPATDTPRIPYFDAFFADLGDSQSIEQHLSSFSGHVLKFKTILEKITPNSLILLDELNSATDPEEGAAFGRAVLETLMEKDAIVVTTTHDPHLKALAVSDPRILVASMAFDEKTRSPTYRMLPGIPGRSRALETAERLGIPQPVIALARKYLSQQHIQFEQMMSRLETDSQEAARLRKEASQLKDEAEKLHKEWKERAETSFESLMEKVRQRLRRVQERAQDEVRATLQKLDEVRNRKELDHTRGSLSETFSTAKLDVQKTIEEEAPEIASVLSAKQETSKTPTGPQLEVGSLVRIPKWKNTGKVVSIQGAKIKVTVGSMQVTLGRDEIELLASAETKSPRFETQIQNSRASSQVENADIDLRGKRFEEAMSELEYFLDFSFRSNRYAEVTVIHGLGTGALREGAHHLLKKLPYVKSYRDGGVGRGGTGATVVEFDR